jgi:hypothetical protein
MSCLSHFVVEISVALWMLRESILAGDLIPFHVTGEISRPEL